MAVRRLEQNDWEVLIRRIRDGKCTPILGPGVYSKGRSMRSEVAQKWATKYHYPLTDVGDLARVARFLTVEFHDAEYAASLYVDELKELPVPDFADAEEPHVRLAKLPLPVYVTTNYDNFMEQALRRGNKDAKSDLCRWISSIDEPSPLSEGHKPNVANPLVFHLYGVAQSQQSLVLSEDDYFQFLINVSKDADLIPTIVQRAITGSSLLLLGFRLDDWDFRVLFHFLAGYLKASQGKTHVAVQISPLSTDAPDQVKERAQAFFDKYFESKSPDIRVSWDTTADFVSKLWTKWEESGNAR